MRICRLDATRKTGKAGKCWMCKKPIKVGELHAVMMLRYGKYQESAFKALAALGRAMTKKAGLKYRRLHLKDCLATWTIATYTFRSEARRAGRPKGSGQLPQMADEDKLARRRLVRRRAEVLRQIIGTEDDTRGRQLVDRLASINDSIGAEVIEGMSHRSQPEIRALNEKLRRFMDGQS